jgi:predicted NAD/FAD-binding protein
MLDCSPTAQVHLGTPARALSRKRGAWFLETPAGRQGPYRFVVLNAPPRAGRKLLRSLPAFADITALLDVYRYFDSRLLVHTDAAYVHRDRRNWGAYNAGVDGLNCEGSVWLGALYDKSASGASVHVFKSWAQRRPDPKHILLERRFKHPLISRSTIKAARALRPLQGRKGLYFSGHYTTGMDLQESALYSAMKVAEALAPDSRTLASLNTRLSGRGRAGISYDL